MVAGEGLEPSILPAADFKSAVYTNSTTQPSLKIVGHPRLELGTSGLKVRCAANCANAPDQSGSLYTRELDAIAVLFKKFLFLLLTYLLDRVDVLHRAFVNSVC